TELQTAGVFGSDAARVPDAILVAIWGMETSYGSHLGSMRVMDALATLAYEGRREAWARGELLAALRLVEQGEVSAE
ncbi:lytic murein transglycosylase, partial [Acinetobacter baumannii]